MPYLVGHFFLRLQNTDNYYIMQLHITYPKQTIRIELLDNPVVDKWLDHLDLDKPWKSFAFRPTKIIDNKEEQNGYRQSLIKSIRDFNLKFGIQFPFEVTDDTYFSNDDLNTIHRYFTTANTFRAWTVGGEFLIAKNDPKFKDWNHYLFQINEEVHKLQNYYYSIEKELTQNVNMITLRHSDYSRTDWFMHEPGDWRHLDYNLEYDVFMQYAICGKEYFQAYIDGDQCGHWDVTAQFSSYYNFFYIDQEGKRNEAMKSTKFKEWLLGGSKYYGAWQYMPIGKVVSGPILEDNFKNLIEIKLVR